MTKFKYRIVNNGRQYLANSMEQYLQSDSYRGESLNIEMAPKDGWFDENGRRCALYFGEAVVLKNWEYTREYSGKETLSIADLTMHPWYTTVPNIVMMDAAQCTLASVSPDGTYEANIRWGEKDAEVTLFSKEWVNVESRLPVSAQRIS